MKIRLIFILFILTVLFVSCSTTGTGDNIQKASAHYQIGLSYYNENKTQMAYVEFQKALELNPNDKEVLNAIGIIYLLKFEDSQKAIEFFQSAITIDPKFSEAHNNLGLAYERTEKYNEAIDSYKRALSNLLYQSPEKAYNNLGRVYYRLGRYDKALDAYKGAIRRLNDFHLPYYGLALCYNSKGQYGEAATAITRAIELDPLYKGNKEQATEDLKNKKLMVKGKEEKDIADFLEILRY